MTYAELHSRFASADVHVGRNQVRDAVIAAAGAERVGIFAVTLNTSVCRGMYFSPRNAEHGLASYRGQHVIAFSRDLNRCWRRLVIVKELMHMMDGAESATDTGEAFERVLSEIYSAEGLEKSPQSRSEVRAFWMALAILVPERHRLRFKSEWQADQSDPATRDTRIAQHLLIPAVYIPALFSHRFDSTLEALLR